MSGKETDDEKDTQAQDTPTKKDKEVIRVPVRWLHPHIVEMLHTVDTWKQFELDESLGGDDDRHGNRPLKRKHQDKPPVVGTVTKRLPKNWYEDIWFKSLPAGTQAKYVVGPDELIPTPVK